MTIFIGKKWEKNSYYIGRGSPLGNPFIMTDNSIEERNRVCDLYDQWFYEQLDKGNLFLINELKKLYQLSKQGDLILGCYCAPKRCHGETIKNFLDSLQ